MNAMRTWWCATAGYAALALVVYGMSGCGAGGDCTDGTDNDDDGLIDLADPACAAGRDNEAPDPVVAECADGIDNDGDKSIDLGDPGCSGEDDDDESNAVIAQCKDGIDNDGDGKVDAPNDPGCDLSLDDDETDECPDGEGCPACADGVDDDGDGDADYPDDPGCDNAADQDEFNSINGECGTAPLQNLPASGLATGTIKATSANVLASPDCGGTGAEIAYQFTIASTRAATFTTAFPETTVDTVIYLRSECQSVATEIACDDDDDVVGSLGSTLEVEALSPGTYYLVVDGRSNGSAGEYRLQANLFTGEGGTCDPDNNECPPGYFCQEATPGAGDTTCEPPRCDDDGDFDGDGEDGYPTDPGCTSATDNDEDDDCPGAGCPACANGMDDDGDMDVDYPDDADCMSAASTTEQIVCATESTGVTPIDGPVTTGSTTGGGDEFDGSCQANTNADKVFLLDVPGNLTTLHLDTNGSAMSDTVLYIKSGSCTASDLACDDDAGDGNRSLINRSNVPAGTYFIIVDGYSTNVGNFTLNVNGTIATGQPCDAGQIAAGLFACQGGGACSTTCQP
jgi:hypothetical protein